MKDLVVAAYGSSFGALQMLDDITGLKFPWLGDIDAALVVSRDAEGRLDVRDTYPPATEEGPEGRVFLGVLLGGLMLAPLTAGVSAVAPAGAGVAGATGAALLAHLDTEPGEFFVPADIGLPAAFTTRVAESIPLDHSAIIALVERREPNEVSEFLRGTGAVVNRITLTPEQLDRIQQLRAGGDVVGAGN